MQQSETRTRARRDPEPDELLPLARAGRRAPGGPATASTVWRWITHGRVVGDQRVRLRYWRRGRKMLTTLDAIVAFFDEVAAAERAEESANH